MSGEVSENSLNRPVGTLNIINTVSAQLSPRKDRLNPEEQTDFEQLSRLTDCSDKSYGRPCQGLT
jgi:hypothetical protein